MNTFFKDYHELLYNCNKPYQYVGGEFLSRNKNPKDAKVTFAFAFPDKYEIGISNLGQRVLYGLVNDHPDFMADRIYAPEVDFKENLIKSDKEFYSLESKIPLKDFDLIGFSLQYELSYPTVLAMLEMAGIAPRAKDRIGRGASNEQNCPIILAGGPCAYNPLPLAAFVDAFLIGDGEEVVLEVCEVIKQAKLQGLSRQEKIEKLSEIEGVFVPEYPKKVKKRIVQIDYENALKVYPIPFSSAIHDRAIVEIRRGCGRMCRFCQPGHVNLPVRERSAEDIIKIAKELVENTGYDEYSLLSLSSNDYSNIKEVIKELGVDFDKKKVSVSLPSQRIDGFNLELANLVQSVRKSTMTLAPEAGSQRLRDFIRKNITQEQILDAVLTLYENGWSKIKFYFIIGLPSETQEDIDEMIKLFEKIKFQTKQLKHEKDLKHGLDLTCTLSIFVPKPFTPFQWSGQTNLGEVTERIHYLKDNTKHIKGLKINYHEQAVSQIETVLTRGDIDLCDYIEKLWQKGCYLDAWGEHFNKDVWRETAEELGISLSELAEKEYKTDEPLPWDFIDIGVEKDWLINEYKDALKSETKPSCETGCVNCGVCKNFKTKKVMDKPYEGKRETGNGKRNETNLSTIHPFTLSPQKYRIKLTKSGILRYFSHLDWQNTFFKALARSGLKVAFSQGFNPTMKVSMGVALPLFIESECELVDIELIEEENPIISLTGKELGEFDNEKDLRKAAIDYYKKNIQGQIVEHPVLGEIKFSKKGLKKTISASADITKLKVLPKIKEIILDGEIGELCSLDKNRLDDITGFRWIKSEIGLEGGKLYCYVNIANDSNGNTYYNVNIDKKIVDTEPANTKASSINNNIIITDFDNNFNPSNLNDIKYSPPTLTGLQNSGVNELKKDLLTVTDKQIPSIDKPTIIIKDSASNFNLETDTKLQSLQLKLEKVMPEGCEIISIVKLDKSVKAIDITVQWAEYEIKLFDRAIQKFEDLRYNMNRVLSSEEILLTKKNKKGFLKTTNIKPAIKSFRFSGESLFIVLKTGQGLQQKGQKAGSPCEQPDAQADALINQPKGQQDGFLAPNELPDAIPALRADDLMKIIAPDVLFNIKRIRFFDECFKEL